MAAPSRSVTLEQTSSDSQRGTRRKRIGSEPVATTKKSNTAFEDKPIEESSSNQAIFEDSATNLPNRSSRSKRLPRKASAANWKSKSELGTVQEGKSLTFTDKTPAAKVTGTRRSSKSANRVVPKVEENLPTVTKSEVACPPEKLQSDSVAPTSEDKTNSRRTSTRKRYPPAKTKQPQAKKQKNSVVNNSTSQSNPTQSSFSPDLKTGGRVSRSRSGRGGGSTDATTGSCTSSNRSRRSSRARPEPTTGMAARDTERQSNQGTDEPEGRVEEPSAAPSSLFDVDGSQMEDAEMTRLQALLEARGLPAHLFGSLGPRMHLLLHRTFSNSTGSKAQQLLTNMQSEDEGQQLQAVMEMCQLLVMGNEETLSGFPVKQAVPVLITLLQMDHNFDIMNHSCRALTYLMEALPRSSSVVVDATSAFLEKVQIIQCMDVAEQSLTALEMLSRRHAKAILQAGGMSSCLLYLDFFSIVAQRAALAIAANCCHAITTEEFSHTKEAVPILSARLPNQDKKSVESVCLAFARLVDNFQKDPKLLEELVAHGLLENLQQLLVISPPLISTGTFVMVIRMLAVMCASCPSIAVRLLNQNISEAIKCLLVGADTDDIQSDAVGTLELVSRSPQELYEIMCLVSELLPPLPTNGVFSVDTLLQKGMHGDSQSGCWQWRDDRNTWHNYMWVDSKILEAAYQSNEEEISISTLGRNYIIDLRNMQQINEDTGTTRPIQRKASPGQSSGTTPNSSSKSSTPDQRLQMFDSVDIGLSFVESLFNIVYVVYYSSVGPAVKHKCLSAILKMLYHTPHKQLDTVLSKATVSSYIAGMMSSQDLRIVCCALQKADILMTKLPDVFHVFFRREGVMHQIQKLASNPVTPFSTPNSKVGIKSDAEASGTASAEALLVGRESESFDSLTMEPSAEDTSKSTDAVKRKRMTRRLSRGKAAKSASHGQLSATASGASSVASGAQAKLSAESLKTRTSTFSGSTAASSTSNSQSFLSSFRPRWGRSHSYSCATPWAKESSVRENIAKQQEITRQKVKEWIMHQAASFYNQYFNETSGDTHPALSVLRQLTRAVEELSAKNNNGSSSLKEIASILDCDGDGSASAFEILHSGVIQELLSYLTSEQNGAMCSRQHRLKVFAQSFLTPLEYDGTLIKTTALSSPPLSLMQLVRKFNLCINQLEQFPVKCHDLPGGSGMSSRGSSVLRFFNTHQIKCNLQRHPDCSNLKRWKGGPVKIDPLALTQAIERYLVVRGYGRPSQPDDDDSDDDDRSDEEIDESWASQLQSTNNPRHFLEFFLNGHQLPYNMTVYQAVRQYGKANVSDEQSVDDDDGPFGRASIWSDTHTILYRPVPQSTDKRASDKSKKAKTTTTSPRSSAKSGRLSDQAKVQDMNAGLSSTALATMTTTDPSLETITLLRVIHHLNANLTHFCEASPLTTAVPLAEFINSKLTSKAMRQLQDPLVIMTNSLPPWLSELAQLCPFLFPFECRLQLFYTVTFDRERAMTRLQENVPDLSSTDTSDRVTPRLEKKKRTVSRSNLFKQAESVIGDMATSKALLEIQYEGEVGTGLGPTLEFYSLVSLEFQKASLEMWRGDVTETIEEGGDAKESVKYHHSVCGLFPAPIGKATKGSSLTRLKSKFRFLGKFIAKALIDSRMIDIPFSKAFYKWMLHQESTMDLPDLQYVDAALFKSLSQLNEVVLRKKLIEQESSDLSIDELHQTLSEITMEGLPIEDLALDFVLPGQSTIELKKNGHETPVTIFNLEEYIKLVVHWTLVEGVSKQMNALREGFNAVFPLSSLSMFFPSELDMLLCGSRSEKWDVKDLTESCRPDHGFNHDSNAIRLLFSVLSQYDGEEQRRFLQFVTGSPRLPVGGFRSLNPPLTIVRKTVEAPANPDSYLPSVMTCVNYLKLPDYSSAEVMRVKLKMAYLEGKNAFHLS